MANKIKVSKGALMAIKVCADSIEKIRPGDAFRLYDEAKNHGVITEIKELLSVHNPRTLETLNEYEKELFEEKWRAEGLIK